MNNYSVDIGFASTQPRVEAIRIVKRMMKSVKSMFFGTELTILSDIEFKADFLSYTEVQAVATLILDSSNPLIYSGGYIIKPTLVDVGDPHRIECTDLTFKIVGVTDDDGTMMKLIASKEELTLVSRDFQMLTLRIILEYDIKKVKFNKTHMMLWVKDKPYVDSMWIRESNWDNGILYLECTPEERKQVMDGFGVLRYMLCQQ